MAINSLDSALAESGNATTVPSPSDYTSLDAALAEKGLVAVDEEIAQEEQPEEQEVKGSRGFFAGAGQMYRMGATTLVKQGVSDLLRSGSVLAYNWQRKYGVSLGASLFNENPTPEEGYLFRLGNQFDDITEYVVPDDNPAYSQSSSTSDQFMYNVAPSAVGGILGQVAGSKGVGTVIKKVVGGAAKKATAKQVGKQATARAAAGREVSQEAIDRTVNAAIKRSAPKIALGSYTAAGAGVGAGITSYYGWEDAVATLKEKAGGRELTDEEMELAWRSYKWNSLNGLSEVMPMMRLFKHLSKVAPKATNRLSQTIDDISIKNPYTTEAIRAGVIEGTQEFLQSGASDVIAAHIVGYDEGRELFENAGMEAAGGGVAGMVLGVITAGVSRRIRLQNKLQSLNESAQKLRSTGNESSARAVEAEAKEIEAMLLNIDRRSGAAAIRERGVRISEEAQSPDPDEVDTSGAFPQVEVETSPDPDEQVQTPQTMEQPAEPQVETITPKNKSSFKSQQSAKARATRLANSDTENIYEVAQNDEGNWVVLKRAKQEGETGGPRGQRPSGVAQTVGEFQDADVIDFLGGGTGTVKSVKGVIPRPPAAKADKFGRTAIPQTADGLDRNTLDNLNLPSNFFYEVADGEGDVSNIAREWGEQTGRPDLTVEEFLQEVADAHQARAEGRTANAEANRQLDQKAEQATEFSEDAFTKKEKGKEKEQINVTSLNVGDEFELNGERVVVTEYDLDRGELTLENGDKYGTQVIEDTGEIYIDLNSKIQEGEGQPRPDTGLLDEPPAVQTAKVGGIVFSTSEGVDLKDSKVKALMKRVASALNSVAKAIGVPFKLNVLLRAGGNPNGSGIAALSDNDGNLDTIVVYPDVLNKQANSTNTQWLRSVMGEEVIHQLHNRAMYRMWENDEQSLGWNEWRADYLEAVWDKMTDAEKARVIETYTGRKDGPRDGRQKASLAMEAVRMVMQGKLGLGRTESGEAYMQSRGLLVRLVNNILNYLNSVGLNLSSDAISNEVSNANKILQDAQAEFEKDMRQTSDGVEDAAASPDAQQDFFAMLEQQTPQVVTEPEQPAVTSEPVVTPAPEPVQEAEQVVSPLAAEAGVDASDFYSWVRSGVSLANIREEKWGRAVVDEAVGYVTEQILDAHAQGKTDITKKNFVVTMANRRAKNFLDRIKAEKRGGNETTISFDQEAENNQGEGTGKTTGETAIADSEFAPPPTESAARVSSMREVIDRAMEGMTPMERRILENDALPLDEQVNTRELAEEFGISQGKMIAEVDMARIKMRRKMLARGLEGTEDFAPAPDLDSLTESVENTDGKWGNGSKEVTITHPESGAFIRIVDRTNLSDSAQSQASSVVELTVPEAHQGKGIGLALQEEAQRRFPKLQGQVSSKAAAKNAYRLGRRPVEKPDATLQEVFAIIDENSSVNMVTPDLDTDDTIEKQTIRENLKDGRYNADVLPQRISQEASRTSDGRTILAAEDVARKSHGAVQQNNEEFSDGPRSYVLSEAQKIGRQVRPLEDAALAEWAESQGMLLTPEEARVFTEEYNAQGRRGGVESIVNYDEASGRYTKINNLIFHTNQLEFLHRLALHNFLFPDVALKLEGYVYQNDTAFSETNPLGKSSSAAEPKLLPVVSQAGVEHFGDEVGPVESGRELEAKGGTLEGQYGSVAEFDNGIQVDDYHDENVLRRENGSLAFIDTDIRLSIESKTDRLREYAGVDGVEDAAAAPDSNDSQQDMWEDGKVEATPEQVQQVLGLEAGTPAVTPAIDQGFFEKLKRTVYEAVPDTLRKMGLSGLADRIEIYEQKRGEFNGKLTDPLRQWRKGLTSDQAELAHEEANEYFAIREEYGSSQEASAIVAKMKGEKDAARRRELKEKLDAQVKKEKEEANARANEFLASADPNTRSLVDTVNKISDASAKISTDLSIMVQGENGKWRLMKVDRENFPRVFTEEVMDAIRSPAQFPELYKELKDALVDSGRVGNDLEAEELLAEFNSVNAEMVGGAYLANMEKARGLRLPAKFYDTSVDAYTQFVLRFANRAAQIHAFGQSTDKNLDAFGVAMGKARDAETMEYLKAVSDAVYQRRAKATGFGRTAQRGSNITSTLFLSGPFTAIRDIASGIALSAETFGIANTAVNLTKALWQTGKNVGGNIRRILSGDLKATDLHGYTDSEMVESAMRMGAIREDFIDAMLLDERIDDPNSFDKAVSKGARYGLYFKQSMDRLARAVTLGASVHWLKTTQAMAKNDPNGAGMKRRIAALKRLGIKGDQVQKLLNDEPAAVEAFARASVAEKQYTYSIAQHPLWLGDNSDARKIFFQFQRWSFQRGRDFLKNVIAPATFGTEVDGKKVHDFMPLIRFAVVGVGIGELLALLRELLTDRERREATVEEISNSEQKQLMLAGDRLLKDVIMTGGIGVVGDYGMMLHETFTRGPRWRDPLKPPVVNLMANVRDTALGIIQQGGDPAALLREGKRFMMGIPPVNQAYGLALGAARRVNPESTRVVTVHSAMRDRAYVRNLTRRFGEEMGYDVESNFYGSFARDEFTEDKNQLREALLIGDVDSAREIAMRLLEAGVTRQGLKQSVGLFQPIAVGRQTKPEIKMQFLRWAKKNTPSGYERIRNTQRTYEMTARRLGLMN